MVSGAAAEPFYSGEKDCRTSRAGMPAGQAEKYCDEEEKMNTEQKTSGKYSSGNVMYEKLSGRALYCMYASGIVTGAVLLIIIGAVNWFWLMPEEIAVGQWISAGLAVLILLDVAVSPYFRYHRYRYSINDECIDIVEGYLFVKRNIVPIERLHKLQTAKGPFDQFFKVAKVVVTTGGGDVTISFLEEEKAEQIADSLRRRINEIVTEQRTENGNR